MPIMRTSVTREAGEDWTFGNSEATLIAQRTTRRKGGRVYGYGWYRCSFAARKGPAICGHGAWYRQNSSTHPK
jgi:hypothetical protein